MGEHGHEHQHTNERVLIEENDMFLSVLEHEESLVASYRLDLSCGLNDAKERLAQFAKSISGRVEFEGGIVGHIKAFAREQGDSFRLSLTADEPDILDFHGSSTHVEGVAIVLLVDEDWYCDLLKEEIATLARQ